MWVRWSWRICAVLVGLMLGLPALLAAISRSPAANATAGETSPRLSAEPDFQVGDQAPDFELPDSAGRAHHLSQLAKSDTILCFACGCKDCQILQTCLGKLVRQMGSHAPPVVTVTTMPRESEASWIRDTGLRQTLLYEDHGGPIMREYRGNPCPRFYHLRNGRTVAWIGPSTKTVRYRDQIGILLAQQLGWRMGSDGDPHFPGADQSGS
jgi:peroxiredoxin